MHYLTFVLIPRDGDVKRLVSEAMAPYDEDREVEQTVGEDGETYWHNPHGFWDFWKIGGRWTGYLSGYDPHSDPALREPCKWCDATGWRDDHVSRKARLTNPDFTCNACDGTGKVLIYTSRWPEHDGDVQDALSALPALTEEYTPYTFVVHGSESVAHKERFVYEPEGESFFKPEFPPPQMLALIRRTVRARREAGFVGDRLVVVDYHS